jgi:predicted enzyme related to lactoylglutathione lyase
MKKMNSVVHFEMPALDTRRMADFYSHVFGWKTQILGEDMGNYVLATTAEIDEKGRPKETGRINGGFYPKTDTSAPHPSVVIAVDDINEAISEIANAGGKVLGEPVEIPGYGLYASFIDTENNRVGMMQPSGEWL